MAFDALEFYQDFSIDSSTEGSKHCQEGWVQTSCPFCAGNTGEHLGFNTYEDYFNCWRCGWKPTLEVIKVLASVDGRAAKEIFSEYQTGTVLRQDRKKFKASSIKLPPGSQALKGVHKKYLRRRKFDPNKLEKIWGLRGTGCSGKYKYRIIAPIIVNGRLVSYQGRDCTQKQKLKYKACKQENEIIDHKEVLYGIDLVQGLSCVLVEGITDAWRLGPGAVASFGISYKPQQCLMLAEKFERVVVMYDDDPQAIVQAEKMAWDLSLYGIDVEIVLIEGDPGDLPQKKADSYMRKLL